MVSYRLIEISKSFSFRLKSLPLQYFVSSSMKVNMPLGRSFAEHFRSKRMHVTLGSRYVVNENVELGLDPNIAFCLSRSSGYCTAPFGQRLL